VEFSLALPTVQTWHRSNYDLSGTLENLMRGWHCGNSVAIQEVMHILLWNAELDLDNSTALKSIYHYKKFKDSNGIFEKKWYNISRTSSY
jgi:hypothetical protein